MVEKDERSTGRIRSRYQWGEEDERPLNGWLHTYSASKDLRLLYINGMAGGKTRNGTLDSQNRILLNDTVKDNEIGDEIKRAAEVCRMAHEVWDDRLDGVIRMEAGFEVILCSFERDLQMLRADQVKPDEKVPHNPLGPGRNVTIHDMLPDSGPWARAVAARYHGIGGNRVVLNYDHFVTAFTYGLDVFGGESKKYRPRLNHLKSSQLELIRVDLKTLIMTHDPKERSLDWQAITDMVVQRYAYPLKRLTSDDLSAIWQLHNATQSLIGPFIEYPDRNITVETERCATQFLPFSAPTQVTAARAVRSVTHSIFRTLLEVQQETNYNTAVAKIHGLIEYLSWSTWKGCRGCEYNEICMVPMWPVGMQEDYDHPRCRDDRNMDDEGHRYWGQMPMPRPIELDPKENKL